MTIHEVSYDIPFVYFPLHMQPELATNPMGGAFFDQALVLECLHARLPKGWKIYVKENPKQMEFMRGARFFERLRLLEHVEIVPRDTSSHALIECAQAVATITGTAGMEALVLGKPVLLFGKVWYDSFSGIVPYDDTLDLLSVCSRPPSASTLRSELAALLQKTGRGIVDPDYVDAAEDYSIERNNLHVYETLSNYVRRAS